MTGQQHECRVLLRTRKNNIECIHAQYYSFIPSKLLGMITLGQGLVKFLCKTVLNPRTIGYTAQQQLCNVYRNRNVYVTVLTGIRSV